MIYATLLTTFSILAFLILGATTIDWVLDSFSKTLTNWFGETEGVVQMDILLLLEFMLHFWEFSSMISLMQSRLATIQILNCFPLLPFVKVFFSLHVLFASAC